MPKEAPKPICAPCCPRCARADTRFAWRRVLPRSRMRTASGLKTIAWSDEHDPPSVDAASAVARVASSFNPDVAAVHNVLDAGVLAAVRANAPRVTYHLHDHRPLPTAMSLPARRRSCTVRIGAASCGWTRSSAAARTVRDYARLD